ncbi:hypothetical protein RO3G_00935 [Lichtheimia corymbifera JMRC:FSU:9682]|uniref:Myb-like domain-containing protein n=1 Tax=Lichtheimia corymbifera JMRC:FSU:9682 TaxID=1263082 RepID=A0A068S9I1_9FUNG|nr:hypothetical protein RO3G_00935 [Lichtheimia corymbifera JMRC:FSU:9682]
MDLKNLLCPLTASHPSDATSIVTNHATNECVKTPPPMDNHPQNIRQQWSTMSTASSEESSSPDMSICYNASPSLTPASSPPSSPYSLPSLMIHPPEQQQQQQPIATPPRNRSGPQTRTPWTQEEDYLLQRGYSQGLSWAMISSTYLPHRSRGCCWGRFKTLQTKTMEHREWSSTEDQMLAMAMKKHSKLFKQAWKAVAQELPNRSWRECDSRFHKVAAGNMVRKRQPGQQQHHHQH